MSRPLYSCLMSVYKSEIPANLELSIRSILGQTIPPEEFFIVEDGPLDDDLREILDSYDKAYPGLFTFLQFEKNMGLWHALHFGVALCRNELIIRMDSDDYSAPNRAEIQLEYMVEHPECCCCGSDVYEFEGSIDNVVSKCELPKSHNEIVEYSKLRNPIRHPSLIYRKSVVLEAGNYREMPFFEDYDLIVRLIGTGYQLHNLKDCLVYMRVNPGFFERRGNRDYLVHMITFRKTLLSNGYVSKIRFLNAVIPHCIVCAMPNTLRTFVYKKFLRKKPKS